MDVWSDNAAIPPLLLPANKQNMIHFYFEKTNNIFFQA